ncbi:MAG: carboxylesterase/lipase family protein [Bacteroidales bacterium]|nr:carboxylesterase/lipase family protein [Bacteroidales bacterium]
MNRSFLPIGIISAATFLLAGCGSATTTSREAVHPGPITAGEHTRVNTTYGTVEGYLDDDVYTFKGIQYAKAGRFLPPQAPDKFQGVRMCKLYGPKAPQSQNLEWKDNTQRDYNFGNQFNLEPMSEENCLVLNVWTKGLGDGKKRPVFFWIHGGGFNDGSAIDLDCYEGRSLADKGDIVTVSINHRLNVLGYMDLRSLGGKYAQSVNLGMQDIVKALEWVRDNIEKFGGDPNCVTIAGQSGGAGKVSTLQAMPSAKGLFHRAIVQSGSFSRATSDDYGRRLGLAFLNELGVKPSQAEARLKDFTYQELRAAGDRAIRTLKAAPGERGGYCPYIDGAIISEQTYDPETATLSRDIPIMIGTNFNEFIFDNVDKTPEEVKATLVERMGEEKAGRFMDEFRKAYPGVDPKYMLYVDTRVRANAIRMVTAKSRMGNKHVYLYHFNWKPENNILGASHGMELPFMFNNVARQRGMTGSSESAYQLQDAVSDYWISFIKTGDPNCAGRPVWEPFTEEKGACMVLDNPCTVRYYHDKALLGLTQ